MAILKVASKANPAIVLPGLLIAEHLERATILPPSTKEFHENDAFAGDESIQLILADGKILSDDSIVDDLVELANGNAGPQRASSVSRSPIETETAAEGPHADSKMG
jgi:hypothetical protein